MTDESLPLVISAPEPRTLDLIFTPAAEAALRRAYRIVEADPEDIAGLGDAVLGQARYILGQPPLSAETLARMPNLRAILNVESNLLNNMPYEVLFERGIHVVTTGQVFAEPVAELGLAMALNLARGVIDADVAFREGTELWGGDGNRSARLLSGSEIGIVGFGDLGRALNRVLSGFRAKIRVFDPWLPPSMLRDVGVEPASLSEVLAMSDFVFVVASVTSENKGFLGAEAFASMRKGAAFILLSRADVVDFPALMAAVETGHIVAASDVYPEEPLPADHPVRRLKGFVRSAHRAGALDSAFKKMGDMVLEDMALMDRSLPPMRCKRAERETVSRMRSKPVSVN
ncbi:MULTISPECIES: hydroxyacid dehydrogenase [unclassified Shinella]|jgi:phosphoglycerate dehydrogenase-like enzyme|uniref:hydroxyacid dehydrogenase n=1 Tax=unclassified Shinella TaxID=2643062 RepID=UPI000682FFB4|nr:MULTISPECIES: hydroxyacid dehydrogenase [unclassified Shinella]KNY14883.1 2-hydroxyacid dehydrogenase [Shinella sp. SUS2]KOC74536.1 2-hydroxyacid dehydrogenase [Shinella sp. GWS1]MCO5152727.1 hydroxyacid dehydrogenase [Shinella sp.]MDC7260719.1 hydroxyacid dehydrogenase [Shinella sp. HY16]MDC7267614.1 hydroxyacid dehydrogenase [Shinella sp. YZ44]